MGPGRQVGEPTPVGASLSRVLGGRREGPAARVDLGTGCNASRTTRPNALGTQLAKRPERHLLPPIPSCTAEDHVVDRALRPEYLVAPNFFEAQPSA